MSESPFLSVIVPVYKQEKTIQQDIEHILDALNQTPYSFEVIPVVDGTDQDNSLRELKKIRSAKVTPTGYKQNRGKGYAVRYGMKKASGKVVTFIDAGMDIDPQGIIMLLEHLKWYQADIIIGSKLHAASVVSYPWWRKLMTYAYYMLVKILFGLKVRDTQTGLKAYRREVLERVLPRLVVKQFAFDIEILAVAQALGYSRIFDAPVKVNLDWEKSTIRMFGPTGAVNVLWDTLAVFYRLRILKYYTSGYKHSRVFDDVLEMFVYGSDNSR
jgi:glycosyltransferase involved in cell wall biosynthesis